MAEKVSQSPVNGETRGLRAHENPFATDRIEARITFEPSWCETDWPAIEARWHELDRRACVVGPHGSGKSTFLRTFRERLQERDERVRELFLNDHHSRLDPADWHRVDDAARNRQVLFLDGAERLGPVAWRRFVRATRDCAGILVTRHRRRPGGWPTLLTTRTTPELLADLVTQLDRDRPISGDAIDAIFRRHRGNLREALWTFYDKAGDQGG